MCDSLHQEERQAAGTIPVRQAIGAVLAHDITEIRPGEFKGPAFKKGHIVREEDVCHLRRLGKEHLFVLRVGEDEMHENSAAYALANALMGEGTAVKGEPREGKISIVATRDGLLKIDKDALLEFNLLGEVMAATLHDNTVVRKGQTLAGTRAIPLVVKKQVVRTAVAIGENAGKIIRVKEIRKPRAGLVITGNEVYQGRIADAFAPVIAKKIGAIGGELAGVHYAPDDKNAIVGRLRDLLDAGADLLLTTGGMSVDPDDVTRFAIQELGATDITYGSAVLPGAMFLVGYIRTERGATSAGQEPSAPCAPFSADVPILGIPACGMYAATTVFDLILPRVLAGERIGRKEVAALGHGGLCLKCDACRYPVCPFGKLG
jgi:Probable molybdopterin binding domain